MPYPHKQACCKDKVLISDRQRKKLNFCYAGQKKERFLTIRGIGQGPSLASIPRCVSLLRFSPSPQLEQCQTPGLDGTTALVRPS